MADQKSPASLSLPVLNGNAGKAESAADPVQTMFATAAAEAPRDEGYGQTYWRSVDEKLRTPEFLNETKGEFPPGADLPPTGVMRREFLQLLGGSMAVAGLGTACSTREEEKILAYTKQPQTLTPGVPLHYASAMDLDGYMEPLLVRAWEGRPTKIEGNPEHPVSQGATGTYAQAYTMGLYDPARARVYKQGPNPTAYRTFVEATAFRMRELAKEGGAKLRFLVGPTSSPLQLDLRQRILQRFPRAKFVSYAPSHESGAREANRQLFGAPTDVVYDFKNADVILSLDADFLGTGPGQVLYTRQFADRRDPNMGEINRLYQVEARYSITGGMADHRLRLRASDVGAFGVAVARALASRVGGLSRFAGATSKLALTAEQQKAVDAIATDLAKAGSRALVVPGERQPAAVHALAHAINSALGAFGSTLRTYAAVVNEENSGVAALAELARECAAGQVDTLFISAWNPVYAAPADIDLRGALTKVPNSIYTSLYEDETADLATWFLPATHGLEIWADGRALDGTITLSQPLINPLFGGISEAELLSTFLEGPTRSNYDLLREYWAGRTGGDFETQWEVWVSQGFIENSAPAATNVQVNAAAADQAIGRLGAAAQGLEINFVTDYKIHDGRFANNAWLQELPDPITKIVWDNAALISYSTAEKLGLKNNDLVKLTVGGRELVIPVFLLPGQADESLTIALGYGRRSRGEKIASTANDDQPVGVNANLLRSSDAMWIATGVTLEKVRGEYELAQTQTHWTMEVQKYVGFGGEALARDIAIAVPQEDATPAKLEVRLARHKEDLSKANLMPEYDYSREGTWNIQGYKWGMAIDLSRCTGCSACVVACQAENNIPVVGKLQVSKGREMHWLRIDRYFAGDEKDPSSMIMQPMLCVQCEKAPCEYVCPVNATLHSDEGISLMVYNRCVGTRYCSNNCPYKVRRFNYLHFSAGKTPTEKMAMNPDVTVRQRGVMEKCTYCIQRIERARIDGRVEAAQGVESRQGKGNAIQEKDLQTACQQACPANAIVFGDLNNPTTKVTKLHQDPRYYKVLHELGTQPRTVHLVRVKNPNPALSA